MNDRDTTIADAAANVFFRYGVKRTTMQDVAREAGLSRQTLYTVHPNKEALLRAVVRLMADRAVTAIEAGAEAAHTLDERLDLIFEHLAFKPYRLLEASPEAGDVVEGFHAACAQELHAAYDRYTALTEKILLPYERALADKGLTPADCATCLIRALKGFKTDAPNEPALREWLSALKALILHAAGS